MEVTHIQEKISVRPKEQNDPRKQARQAKRDPSACRKKEVTRREREEQKGEPLTANDVNLKKFSDKQNCVPTLHKTHRAGITPIVGRKQNKMAIYRRKI